MAQEGTGKDSSGDSMNDKLEGPNASAERKQQQQQQQQQRRQQHVLKVATVGDGDLTLSLALSRAYGDQLDLTATTLCASLEELCRTYSNSADVIQELIDERLVNVVYDVDATNLASSSSSIHPKRYHFDLVLFHHPHLGLMTSKSSTDEQHHAQRHFVLLAHYLASAKSLLLLDDDDEDAHGDGGNNQQQLKRYYDGRIHLCLAHDQAQTWQMEQAAQMQGLQLVHTADTGTPFHTIVHQLFHKNQSKAQSQHQALTPLPPAPGHAAPRRYRNGKLGSKHWLGRYGYQHRRTHGNHFDGGACDMNVEGSRHYFFAPIINAAAAAAADNMHRDTYADTKKEHDSRPSDFPCSICGLSFASAAALQKHLEAPALPDSPPSAVETTEPECHGPAVKRARQENSSGDAKQLRDIPESRPRTDAAKVSSNSMGTAEPSSSSESTCWTVVEEQQGKRLRRFLQHVAFPKRSRKQCDNLVADGQILVNGDVAPDTSRILSVGDVVSSILAEEKIAPKLQAIAMDNNSEHTKLQVVASYPSPLLRGGGDTTTFGMNQDDAHTSSSSLLLPNDYLVVVNKPVGMRTKGDYELARSTEHILSWQLTQGKFKYKSLSSMDTGCGGLCVLQLQQQQKSTTKGTTTTPVTVTVNVSVKHDFTVLVHGHVPSAWDEGISVEVPWRSVRRWGRQAEVLEANDTHPDADDKEPQGDDNCEDVDPEVESASAVNNDTWMMKIICIERTSLKRRSHDDKPAPALCTLTISTACPVSGLCRAIILYLRKQLYPVVGDRLCQREYQQLPRSIRNRLKKKLCFGCFKVDVNAASVISSSIAASSHTDDYDNKKKAAAGTDAVVETGDHHQNHSWRCVVDVPEKLQASYWQRHWESATVFANK